MIEKNIVGVRRLSEQIPVFRSEEGQFNQTSSYEITGLKSTETNLNLVSRQTHTLTNKTSVQKKLPFDKSFQNMYEKDSFTLQSELRLLDF